MRSVAHPDSPFFTYRPNRSRFATATLPYRVVIGIDDEDERLGSLELPPAVELELGERRGDAPSVSFAEAMPRLIQPAR